MQLLAQEAKAWARMANQRNGLHAWEKRRALLDSLPYPERTDNHFVVEPDKFDFYAMDCYRLIGDDRLAETLAHEIIKKATALDGTNISPMRKAEAELTLGVIAARHGTVDDAVGYGHRALSSNRRSHPTLLMVGSELDHALRQRYPDNPDVQHFHNSLADIAATTRTR